MINPSLLAAPTKTLRDLYAAINRNDPSAFVSSFDSDIEWIEPHDYPSGGIHRGIPAIQAHFVTARATWAEGSCEPQRFIPANDNRIVVMVHVHVRLKDQSEWLDAHIADVFTFRNGRIIEMRHFPDSTEALKWAGVEDSDPAPQ